MIIGIRDTAKLAAITVVVGCAVFVCALFLTYNLDIAGIRDSITTEAGRIAYAAQKATGKVVAAVTGGSLGLTSVGMLVFYIKNYIDSHARELGTLQALGYADVRIAGHFWVFGLSVFGGCILGYAGAMLYMPAFYEKQNAAGFFPVLLPQLHAGLAACLILLPTAFFMGLAVVYALFKMKCPVLQLLTGVQEYRTVKRQKDNRNLPFLRALRKNTQKSRRSLRFFMAFSAFCFSAMTQMSMSMKELSSESFSLMILLIGLVLAGVSLTLSLSSVIKANAKTVPILKAFGYSDRECRRALLGGYRPVAYVGFAVGTVYQYALLKAMVTLVYADYEGIPAFRFQWRAFALSLLLFIAAYECLLYGYAAKMRRLSVREMLSE